MCCLAGRQGQLDLSNIYGKYCCMKTTFDLPEELLRESKAAAALCGQSMKEYVQKALEDRCWQLRRGHKEISGWRAVFGKASSSQVAQVDEIVRDEFSRIDKESW